MIVWVIVVFWVCFFDILNVFLFNILVMFNFFVIFFICLFIFWMEILFKVIGNMMFFFIVSVLRRLNDWKINFNCFLWNNVKFFDDNWKGFVLFIKIFFDDGELIVDIIFNNVVFLLLDGFIIFINLFFWIDKLILINVL